MSLFHLINPWFTLPVEFDRDIAGLSLDSRKIKAGYLFVAMPGEQVDGRDFIAAAIKQGAAAVIAEEKESSPFEKGGTEPAPAKAEERFNKVTWYDENKKIPYITLPHLKEIYGHIAARFYDYPSRKLQVIGVTGTNGKTSITHFIAQILARLGKPCGVIGTIGNGVPSALQKTINTTPDAITIQALLADFCQQGLHSVAMEVASHALDQHRVNGIEFAATIFTNLTQDHLDYHGSMENYAATKKRLFTEFKSPVRVLNADDEYGKKWAEEFATSFPRRRESRVLTFQTETGLDPRVRGNDINSPPLTKGSRGDFAVFIENATFTQTNIHATITSPWGSGEFSAPLLGQFNLSNLLAVITTLCALGENFDKVLEQLPHLTPVPGRMQLVTQENKPKVIVDYAHTPDALEKALQTLVAYQPKELWCVFGCGGDRDKTKRPIMGAIAARYADKIVLTDDNCRTEKSSDILNDISAGIPAEKSYHTEADRALAIAYAITYADPHAMILVAGKGHEDYQEINGVRHFFSDVETAQKCFLRD